ncbi:hypothetical protein ABVK25_005992 [Lepraria finkii]|uniref:GST N-terminal domain-containing protein n=1 Tax=Lepraria finkii TaxID=1340010 RepID=A0ABR4B8D4_9LECA
MEKTFYSICSPYHYIFFDLVLFFTTSVHRYLLSYVFNIENSYYIMASHNDIVFFHYQFSPFARKVILYLTLRGIDYAQCLQPVYLPREDIDALGVKYRRIPIMSIGRDIYCDTRLILQKLEEKFPNGALGASQPDQKAVEKLLESWTVDGGIFMRAAQTIPPEMPLLKNPKFIKDREDYTGRSWSQKYVKDLQPEGITHVRDGFEFLEKGLLADGRQWILKTEKPSLADIEAIWPFHWVLDLKSLPPTLVSKEIYPKVYAWIDRFKDALAKAKSSAPKPTTLKGAEAVKHITQADFAEPEGQVDSNDPLGLKKGQDVESWPIDSGFMHHDRGRLVSINSQEVVLTAQSKVGDKEVRIHHPRWNFRTRAVGSPGTKL